MGINVGKKIQEAGVIVGGLGMIGFLCLIWVMIYGNMSGNVGFAAGTQGYNDTEAIIANQTGGILTFAGFSNTFYTIAAIVLLVFMFLGLLAVAWYIMDMGNKRKGGYS